MEIQYRYAGMDDLDEICSLVGRVIDCMEANRIFQWDECYPAKEDFADDIRKNELYVGMMGDVIAVIYTLNKDCDKEYMDGRWRYMDCDHRVLHRLCVNPEYQHRGIAGYTLNHIENELKRANVGAVRLDVFSGNPFALALYRNAGYEKVGAADWRKGRFFLMEKGL